jgi:hypothetical protein
MINFMFFCFPAYVIAQVVAIWRLRSGWRWASLVPVPPMIFVVAATIKFFIEQGNLWPLLLLFSSPVALLYVLAIFGLHQIFKKKL